MCWNKWVNTIILFERFINGPFWPSGMGIEKNKKRTK
jgi:hypothetical protein